MTLGRPRKAFLFLSVLIAWNIAPSAVADVAIDPAKTKFRVGSTAKSMTAMGLGVLYESGKIDLDVPIQTYVPEFLSAVAYASITEALSAFSDDPVLFQPGSRYSYSTQGYILLSAAIERTADQEYLAFMSENVFGPIGMKSTVADRVVPITSDIDAAGRQYC